MKKAKVFVDDQLAGILEEVALHFYRFVYTDNYMGPSVSLCMPTSTKIYEYNRFPPFFEGLLPEGLMLEGLLKGAKIDRFDFMQQLIAVGGDLVGNVTVEALDEQ